MESLSKGFENSNLRKSLSMSIPKTIDSSLRSDSFTAILTDLENASLSSDLPPHLAKKLKENHAWFVETLSLYKKPNAGSRVALNLEKIKAVAAARVLSMLFITAYYIEPNSSGNVCFGLDDKQIADIRHSVKSTLVKQLDQNGDLFVATVNLLTAATHYQKHLQLPHVILKLHDHSSFSSVPITLKFLLTLARVRGGVEMLLSAGFFSSLRALFAYSSGVVPSTIMSNDKVFIKHSDKTEKPQTIWGLSLAVVVAMIHSLGDSSYTEILDKVIPCVLSEKAELISYYISAPDFPSDSREKKRPLARRTQTSLSALKETEHTLMLMCELIASENLPEELEFCKKPSFLNSRNGLFSLPLLCCASKPMSSAFSVITTATVGKGHSVSADLVALHIYRISFLLLKYLCMETEGAAKRSEEVGFADLTQIPELPMLEILHGLQDQAVAIAPELCGSNKSRYINSEIQSVCLLLLPIMEMALYLEFCVLQICGRSPVLGRVEEFSKEVKLLSKAMGVYVFLKASVTSLKHLISLLYPVLSKTEGL
ncbi:hypothetical protein NC652_011680 [Populus alba x Populus x berolinensis]|nr:hypothetical protein NC652_011680 [Populus alba x Populus x berolinensis]